MFFFTKNEMFKNIDKKMKSKRFEAENDFDCLLVFIAHDSESEVEDK
jgi:hypothetical protein